MTDPLPVAPAGSASAREASAGSAIRLGVEIVVRTSSVLATLWLTRSLGVSTFGAFLLVLSLGLMIAELSDLGLNAIVVPAVVRNRTNLRLLYLLKAALTGGVLLLCAALIPLVARLSGIEAGLVTLTTVHFLGASWIEFAGTTLRALGRRGDEALLLFIFRLTLLGLVVGAPFGTGLWGATLSYAFATGPALGLGGWLLRSSTLWGRGDRSSVRWIMKRAAPMGANSYLAILSTRIEIFLLQAFQGAHLVGLFGGASRIVESLLSLPSAIAAGALPSVSRDVVMGSSGAAQRSVGLVVWLGAPCAVGLALCAPGVLGVLGADFVEATWALRILSVALFLCFSNAALLHVLIAAGETAAIPRLTASRVAAALVLGAVLVPTLGSEGAALSFTGAEFFLLGSLLTRARAHADIEIGRPLGWALTACVPMGIVLLAIQLPLLLSIAAGVLSFAIMSAAILRRGTEAAGLA